MKDKQKTTLVFIIMGILVGYASFLVTQSFETNLIQPFLALFVLFISSELIKLLLKINKKMGWFMGAGGWVYLFIWFIAWVVFYNL